MAGTTGFTKFTASGQILNLGDRIRVYNVNLRSNAAVVGVVTLRNGGSGGTAYFVEEGGTGTGLSFSLGRYGMLFPAGCYVEIDSNTSFAVVNYHKEN